jgi:hypothetical protein
MIGPHTDLLAVFTKAAARELPSDDLDLQITAMSAESAPGNVDLGERYRLTPRGEAVLADVARG